MQSRSLSPGEMCSVQKEEQEPAGLTLPQGSGASSFCTDFHPSAQGPVRFIDAGTSST